MNAFLYLKISAAGPPLADVTFSNSISSKGTPLADFEKRKLGSDQENRQMAKKFGGKLDSCGKQKKSLTKMQGFKRNIEMRLIGNIFDVNKFSVLRANRKSHFAGHRGKQCIIFTATNIFAGMDFGSALTQNNAASMDQLTTGHFHAKAFGVAIATIPGTTATFLMSHSLLLILSIQF
jgi:hypothetical protein